MPTALRPAAPRRTARLLAAAGVAWAGAAGAQPITVPGVGAARVDLEGGVGFDPTAWGVIGAYVPFVTPRLQVGVAPEYQGVNLPSAGLAHRYALAALANYVVPTGARSRVYAGGYVQGSDATRARGRTSYGGQAGALYFVAPAAALRAEYRNRRVDVPGARWQQVAVVALDPYVGGGTDAGTRWRAPSLGAVDAGFAASVFFTGRDYYTVRGTLAPFIARWLQAGVRADASYSASYGRRLISDGTAFGRLYLPLPGRTAPYAEASGSGYSGFNGSGRLLDHYAAEGGVRRYVGPSAAFDLGVNWTRQRRRAESAGLESYRAPDRTTLRVGVVTHLRARAAR